MDCQHPFDDIIYDGVDDRNDWVEIFCNECGHNIECSVEQAVVIFEKKLRKYLDE